MKKFIATLIAMCILFGTASAQALGVNLVELSRRYYYALDLFEIPSTKASVLENDNATVLLDGAAVMIDYDKNLCVTKASIMLTEDDDILRLASIATALSTPIEQITYDKLGSIIDDMADDKLGDYYVSLQHSVGSGDLFFIELKESY